jgi:hypothetical protein
MVKTCCSATPARLGGCIPHQRVSQGLSLHLRSHCWGSEVDSQLQLMSRSKEILFHGMYDDDNLLFGETEGQMAERMADDMCSDPPDDWDTDWAGEFDWSEK